MFTDWKSCPWTFEDYKAMCFSASMWNVLVFLIIFWTSEQSIAPVWWMLVGSELWPHEWQILVVSKLWLVLASMTMKLDRQLLTSLQSNNRNIHLTHAAWSAAVSAGVAFHRPTKRGCRGGAHKQRWIAPIAGNRHALLFLGKATGANPMNHKQCANKQSNLCTMTMCLTNAQSVRNKVPELTEYIIEHAFDTVAITETWIRNTPDDDKIIRAMQIPGYTFIHVTRGHHSNVTSRGGWVALLYKSNMKLAAKSSWKAKSFENIEVPLTASSTVKRAVIYRPPPSKRNKSTVGLFMTEFQDFLEHHTVKSQNILIVGDFNFHYEDPSNDDACRFRVILSNHALCQQVSGSTHMAGHILDLIITQSVDNIVSNTVVSDFLTDHAAIHCHLHLPKPQTLLQKIQYRN